MTQYYNTILTITALLITKNRLLNRKSDQLFLILIPEKHPIFPIHDSDQSFCHQLLLLVVLPFQCCCHMDCKQDFLTTPSYSNSIPVKFLGCTPYTPLTPSNQIFLGFNGKVNQQPNKVTNWHTHIYTNIAIIIIRHMTYSLPWHYNVTTLRNLFHFKYLGTYLTLFCGMTSSSFEMNDKTVIKYHQVNGCCNMALK